MTVKAWGTIGASGKLEHIDFGVKPRISRFYRGILHVVRVEIRELPPKRKKARS